MQKDTLSLFDWAYILACFLLLLVLVMWMDQIIKDLLWVLFSHTDQGAVLTVGPGVV